MTEQQKGKFDLDKQIAYWRNSSDEDWEVANELVDRGRTRHGLFFAHLALEKMLKAHVCRTTQELAPKIHNLLRLSQLSGLSFSVAHQAFLARFDRYQLEGRYPEHLPSPPEKSKAQRDLKQAEEVRQWLKNQL